MNEYIIKYRVSTEWHNPYNTTTHNDYTEIVTAKTASEAVQRVLPSFSNPNKSVEVLSVKKI
jgi:hypothetical protein